ncbi:MAG TPA: YaaR family protein [Desulfobacteria bacterium]|nr:YaaR family protein [Desulfobacteria bacterium]
MEIRKISKNVTSGVVDHGNRAIQRTDTPFAEQLQKVQNDMIHQQLESLLGDIEKQGKVLGQSQNLRDLKKYKDLIQKFLDYAVNKMYSLKEQTGWDRRGRHKIYTMIETVNQELENLTEMLITGQQDKISILDKLDEIRGLLVDIYS